MVVKIDGVPGESVLDGHAGEIDVKSFQFGVKNPPPASGGGGGGGGGAAGKPQFSDVTFSKLFDSASPKLFQRVATGQHIASVTFTFRRPGSDGKDHLTYKLSGVQVSGYEQGGAKQRPLLEQVSLNFVKVQVSYTPASGGAPVTAGWDVKANASA